MKAIEIHVEDHKNYNINEVLELTEVTEACGLVRKIYTLKPEHGIGSLISCSFDGISVRQLNMRLYHDIQFNGLQEINALVLSAMFDGEKKISIPESNIEIIQESFEGYISYMDTVEGFLNYSKNKSIREIVIKMSPEFIKKHQLDSLLPIYEQYSIQKLQDNFTYQLDSKTQDIISELISDNRQGLLKRLFLESKILELLSLQIGKEEDSNNTKASTAIKKVYLAKDIISKNLDIQFSIGELAKKVYLNEFLLKKEFKRVFAVTIFEFALQARMEKARNLLANTSIPIYEIAESVGYKNPTHFSAAFKKIEKMTPKQFRKTI